MKKKLLKAGALLLGVVFKAQFLTYVGTGAVVTVSSNTLVYNGGGIDFVGTGKINNSGNIMLVGDGSSQLVTAANDSFNLISDSADPQNKYGQLYIEGFTQNNLSGVINKQYATVNNGTYQQIGLPFFDKTMASLGTELGKTFGNKRYTKNEILTWNNATAVSDNFLNTTNTSASTATSYFMLGANSLDFTTVHNLIGRPFAELAAPVTLHNAANGINFGVGTGDKRNSYNEKYNTYLQDFWDDNSGAGTWQGNYGRNIYQYANPFFTNLDLTGIYKNAPETDLNFISNIQGIRFSPGTVVSSGNYGGTYSTNAVNVAFTTVSPFIPTGDVDKLVIKPLQTFVIKLRDNNTAQTLNFNTLRRFGYTAKTGNGSNVTSSRSAAGGNTVKQLGVIAYDKDNNEMGRTYYVVYDKGVSGHSPIATTEVSNSSANIIGTFEEDAKNGGIDPNFENKYWLYINEANEKDFTGKAIPMMLYNPEIKTLKFEIRENAELINNGNKNLSTGIGFHYKDASGDVKDISQGQVVSVNGDNYSLFYGKPSGTLATGDVSAKPSRTVVVYNPAIDDYIVRFDPSWKKAQINVYDMSGKLVLVTKNTSTDSDFILKLSKDKRAYIVTAVSEKGEKATAKIVR